MLFSHSASSAFPEALSASPHKSSSHQAEIVTDQRYDLILAHDPRSHALRECILEFPQCQVCGDDRSLVPVQALIHTVEHLRRRKGIDQLRSQIIDDQKVTVQDLSLIHI